MEKWKNGKTKQNRKKQKGKCVINVYDANLARRNELIGSVY